MRWTCLVLAAGLSFNISMAQEKGPDNTDLTDLPIEDLMNIKIVTASKEEQSLSQATSITSVVTRREIVESGATTIYELLKRIPGFFSSHQATWSLMTSRGLPSDGNDHFLLLIDGHPQNSIVGQGFQQQDLIPTLDKVERIEIIRGPGSVLWGSSAAMGIVNIITLSHVEKSRVTLSGRNGDGLQYGNLLSGIGDGSTLKGYYSLTTWQAKGYTYRKDGQGPVAFPWGSESTDSWFKQWPSINAQRGGFELYSKLLYKNETEVIARVLKTSFNYVWDEWSASSTDAKHELGNRRAYLSVRRRKAFDTTNLDFSLFGDYNLQNRDPLQINNADYTTRAQDQTNEEFAAGAEALLTGHPAEDNTLKVGVKVVRTELGPNRDARLNPVTNTPIDQGSDTDTNGNPFNYSVPYFGTEPGIDNTAGLYFEDSQKVGRATIFAGARYDWNDFRESGGKILPRAGYIYNFSDEFVGKYTYNTGYLRPSAVYSKTVGYIIDKSRGGAFPLQKVSQSESVESHDVQFSYSQKKVYAAVTFFYMQVRNFISFDANNTPQGYKNIGNASTKGVELESKHGLSSSFTLYENVSYAEGTISDSIHQGALSDPAGRTLNYPKVISNLGITWNEGQRQTFNLNALYWTDMRYIKGKDELTGSETSPVYGVLSNRVYFDASYNFKDAFTQGMNLNLIVFNILDNQERVGMVVNNGTYRPMGRTAGVRLGYEF